MAQPHKGDRHLFATRLPRPVADRVIAAARERGMNYGEFIASVMAEAVGMPDAVPLKNPQPERLPLTA